MRKFLKRIALLGLLALAMNILLAIVVYSIRPDAFYKHYEVCMLLQKQEALLKNPDRYNTIFIGSSKTFRQVDPVVFDSVITASTSFNLGQNGLKAPRNYDFINQLIQQKSDYEAIFFELIMLDNILDNYQSDAIIRSINLNRCLQAYEQAFKNKSLKPELRFRYLKYYTLALGYKYIGFSMIKRLKLLLGILPHENAVDCANFDLEQYQGFISMDEEMEMTQQYELVGRRKLFTDHPFKSDLYKGLNDETINIRNNLVNREFESHLIQWKAQGLPIYFIVPPRTYAFELDMLGQFKAIAENEGFPVFDFSNPAQYPDLHNLENSFDHPHLNKNGARIFTQLLAEQYLTFSKN
ncbi:MAG TPA: hypothetical protein PKA00_13330 [Saprospiraceae bacterium]|nr:hypothetical protein [Saprospiraceae bacterium]HMQ83891.1 hypothetical protein [Saprospiraceae bacterium]